MLLEGQFEDFENSKMLNDAGIKPAHKKSPGMLHTSIKLNTIMCVELNDIIYI